MCEMINNTRNSVLCCFTSSKCCNIILSSRNYHVGNNHFQLESQSEIRDLTFFILNNVLKTQLLMLCWCARVQLLSGRKGVSFRRHPRRPRGPGEASGTWLVWIQLQVCGGVLRPACRGYANSRWGTPMVTFWLYLVFEKVLNVHKASVSGRHCSLVTWLHVCASWLKPRCPDTRVPTFHS